ncbi:MAG TPA: glutamate-5-semialdehyde dehydrogenase [Spirochaetota bacterium]|nr:glutamate-5-semialdehyde dehydrogenase [Spirochaetota bacterium]HPG51942.1 glutamate-5-semialdehyde dehydrogenase [Spirochaetota bacterium]HPN11379.1 glutamate-5-semialdehyde dehydrogenase [Spirochaetota bacterium]HQL81373.1 glutamate-5-semialdehyde dehydrogenase [Spirochaetota bacterium]
MDNKQYIEQLCRDAKASSRVLAVYSTERKNNLLLTIASELRKKTDYIIGENKKDLAAAEKEGVGRAMYDRLLLNRERIEGMAASVEEIARMHDPIGRIENMKVRPSGIRVGQMRIPLGVVAVIYESRPNVTTDIAALCIKSGNATILRGGKEAIHSNTALHQVIRQALAGSGAPQAAVTFIDRTDRELVPILLKMNCYIDIVIPRGGESLIKAVTEDSTIPVIKHDKGVCHTFIDAGAAEEMANRIVVNAKVQRPGVCNAMETLLIHRDYPHKESLLESLLDNNVELRGCARTVAIAPGRVKPAAEEDWGHEFLDLVLAVKIVDSLDEALEHIVRYCSNHSEAIVTNDYMNAERFLREVDSSAVFVNASTRFHDGGEFGLGAEVGISTQKLHAYGTMGVEGLTTLKYVIYGKGEVR